MLIARIMLLLHRDLVSKSIFSTQNTQEKSHRAVRKHFTHMAIITRLRNIRNISYSHAYIDPKDSVFITKINITPIGTYDKSLASI